MQWKFPLMSILILSSIKYASNSRFSRLISQHNVNSWRLQWNNLWIGNGTVVALWLRFPLGLILIKHTNYNNNDFMAAVMIIYIYNYCKTLLSWFRFVKILCIIIISFYYQTWFFSECWKICDALFLHNIEILPLDQSIIIFWWFM